MKALLALLVSLFSLSTVMSFAGTIPDLNVMGFVNHSSYAKVGENESQSDQNILDECQSYINYSLEKLINHDFSGAIENAQKINALIQTNKLVQNEAKVSRLTIYFIKAARSKLAKIIANESLEQNQLEALYQAAHLVDCNHGRGKCCDDNNWQTLIFTKIIKLGLKQQNFNLVMKAAHDRDYWGTFPADTSWDRIIRELLDLPQKPQIDAYKLVYLEPNWDNQSNPFWQVKEPLREIFETLKKRNWKLPGYEVTFNVYFSENVLYWKVEGIRGPDFYMGFCFIQGKVSSYMNNTAGMNSMVIPRFGVEVFSDSSGPYVMSYFDKDWETGRDQFLQGPFLTAKGGVRIEVSHEEINSRISKYLLEFVLPEIKKTELAQESAYSF